MSNFVEYDELAEFFENNNIWMNSNEAYWYEYAWSILTQVGMTKYETELEHYMIYIYALALKDTYAAFCELVFEESYSGDLLWMAEDYISELIIGQLIANITEDGCIITDFDDALRILVDHTKYLVYHQLKRKISESEVFSFMYSANKEFITSEYDEDNDDYFEYERVIGSMEEFKQAVGDEMADILNEVDDRLDGFDFVCQLMK